MDSFTENLLSRARERQKMIQDYCESNKNSPKKHLSEQNLNTNVHKNVADSVKSSSETNISKSPHKNSLTRIMSDFSSNKTLNIKNDNFNMEIKVSSADDVCVEVQIEEEVHENDFGLRPDAKKRLNRLGQLYAGGDDANISSPIHKTEGKFAEVEDVPKVTKQDNSKRGLNKLAELAQTINQFEDDLTHAKPKSHTPVKKSWKPPAPQPPEPAKTTSVKPSIKPKAPNPPAVEKPSKVTWDKEVLHSLESQGFTRTDSSSRLVYKYASKDKNQEKENRSIDENKILETKKANFPQKSSPAIASKAAMFESSPVRVHKDPALLSVSERMALFERNKGAALLPKAPFAQATPIQSEKSAKTKAVVHTTVQENVPPAGKIAGKVAALLESKSTISQQQIEDNIRKQRKEEMEVLLNRFQKPEVAIDDNEYQDDATEETAMIPDKFKKTASVSCLAEAKSCPKRSLTGKGDSPKVSAILSDVKRIKVSPQKAGHLYPSLTDIESATETETRSPTPTPHCLSSSFESSSAESDDANTSFGRDLLQVICRDQTPKKREISLEMNNSDLSDVLDDSDDYIDQALAYNDGQSAGPTPPKKGRNSPIEPSHSFHYKSFQAASEFKSPLKGRIPAAPPPQIEDNLPTHVIDGDNVLPLTHTVSFYRKQQSQASTPVRQISRQAIQEEPAPNADMYDIQLKITELKIEVAKQEMIISQTSQALNLCHATPEFMGSTEQVEAERVLLLATHRRQAALHEIQRLEVEKTMRPYANSPQLADKGTMTVSKIVLPLKQKYVTALAAAGGKGHHVVCLVKYADQVLSTQLVSTVASNSKNPELELAVPGVIRIENVYSSSPVTFEVYCLQAQEEVLSHEIKYHIKKANVKSTPKKSKQESRLMRPIKESPAGPQVVRSPTFALMGYVAFSVPANKKHWSLNNTPTMSPLEGIVEMSVCCDFPVSVEHRGFLTMFQDVSGFGAWHRRWCLLKGCALSYWKYPDDEKKTSPINVINLTDAVSKEVGPVSREICARLHTFLLETERPAHPADKNSLVTVCQGSKTRIRHLLSADTKEERIEWCNKFNKALGILNLGGSSR